MLRVLLFSYLAALTTGHYGERSLTCEPKQETIVVTRTTVDSTGTQVTQFDVQSTPLTLDVTRTIVIPSRTRETVELTEYPSPETVTHTSYVTAPLYQTSYQTSFATAVSSITSRLVVTSVAVEDLTITQTAVVTTPVTRTVTLTDVETSLRTLTVTDTDTVFVTKTKSRHFLVTETSYKTFFRFSTRTVTSTSDSTTHVIVTITDRQYVTKCFQPRVTYEN